MIPTEQIYALAQPRKPNHENRPLGDRIVGRIIGGGRYSDVYSSGNECLKIFHIHDFDSFSNEAKIMAYLNVEKRSNILRMIGIGSFTHIYDDLSPRIEPYIVYERADISLSKLMRQAELPHNIVKKYTHELLLALDYCHSKNVVHSDVKPENLLVSGDFSNLENTRVILADFGSSSILPELYTSHPGTYEYLPPEVVGINDSKYDTSFDIWALMCTVFEMFTGERLFDLSSILGSDSDSEGYQSSSSDENVMGNLNNTTNTKHKNSRKSDSDSDSCDSDSEDVMIFTELLGLYERVLGKPPAIYWRARKPQYYNKKGKLVTESTIECSTLEAQVSYFVKDPTMAANIIKFLKQGIRWMPHERATARELLQSGY